MISFHDYNCINIKVQKVSIFPPNRMMVVRKKCLKFIYFLLSPQLRFILCLQASCIQVTVNNLVFKNISKIINKKYKEINIIIIIFFMLVKFLLPFLMTDSLGVSQVWREWKTLKLTSIKMESIVFAFRIPHI